MALEGAGVTGRQAKAVDDQSDTQRPIEFLMTPPATDPARTLLDAAEATLAELYGPPGSGLPRDELLPPAGGYLVGWEGGLAVAGGGYTRHEEGVAEIRRMFVIPESRSRGIARKLLVAVEHAARAAGYTTVILDTGAKQPHAEALYRSAGYEEIAKYRATSRASYWGAKRLD